MTNTQEPLNMSSAPVNPSTSRLPFSFNGTGKEFFGIWIVNILLTIVTLGIYSAWAKVRTKRYFNGNTQLDGHRFDYHANPVSILKGRIVVVVVLIVLNLISQWSPILAIAVFAFYAIALPWVIVRGLKFNANMTSYRNIRFGFSQSKWNAFKAYIMWPFLSSISLGALIPFASRANAQFLGNGHSYGSSRFSAEPPLRSYYNALGLSAIVMVLFLLLSWFLIDQLSTVFDGVAGFVSVFALPYIGFLVAFLIYAAYSRNIGFGVLNLTNLKGFNSHRFESTVQVKPYLWIIITNFLLTVITLGLYIPWAKVRLAKYLADNTAMLASGDLEGFTASMVDDSGVASGEFLDIEGIDFGL